MNKKRFLVIIFFILLLYSFSSLASIPGDFNSDGKVDFEDLMIFALAYGSTSGSSNWNPSCDLHTDNKIDFEDLMLFAMHYGEEEPPVHNLTQNTYYQSIQEAIDNSNNGDTIVVSPGTYYENIVFDNRSIIVRSTNPSDSAVVAATIIHGALYRSIVQFIYGDTSILQGFTIRYGNAPLGGGITVDNHSSPSILDNIITGNKARFGDGGGIYVAYYSSPTITRNIITGNEAGHSGGGIAILDYSSPLIVGNTITANTSGGGGGISIESNSFPNIQNNTINSNTSDSWGGGIDIVGYSSPTITGNTILLNTAAVEGGGIYVSTLSTSTIGGEGSTDTVHFNEIGGNTPDQIYPADYPHNYIYDLFIP